MSESKEEASKDSIKSYGKCLICFEEKLQNQNLGFLPCSHGFHQECIDEWLKNKSKCPICKVSIYVQIDAENPEEIPERFMNPNDDNTSSNALEHSIRNMPPQIFVHSLMRIGAHMSRMREGPRRQTMASNNNVLADHVNRSLARHRRRNAIANDDEASRIARQAIIYNMFQNAINRDSVNSDDDFSEDSEDEESEEVPSSVESSISDLPQLIATQDSSLTINSNTSDLQQTQTSSVAVRDDLPATNNTETEEESLRPAHGSGIYTQKIGTDLNLRDI